MNDTQWVFELEAMNQAEQEKISQYRSVAEIFKKQVIHMLGLDLCPVEDPDTNLLRMPDVDECIPLAAIIGRDDVLKMIEDRMGEYLNQEHTRNQLESGDPNGLGPIRSDGVPADIAVELTPEELEEFMSDPGDVDFENSHEEVAKALNWASPLDRSVLETVVLNKDDIDAEGDVSGPSQGRTLGQLRQDLKSDLSAENAAQEGSTLPVDSMEYEEVSIVSDEIPETVSKGTVKEMQKLSVTLEEG